MNFVQIDPPGTWCTNKAFLERVSPITNFNSFVEVGPGEGKLSKLLCSSGLKGFGIDFSPLIIKKLSATMGDYIKSDQYSIIKADFMKEDIDVKVDLVFSMMVLEHIEDDLAFLKKMKDKTRPGGKVLVCVPGRKNKWGIEDEISGHLRRYSRSGLIGLFEAAGLRNISIQSLNVPVSNFLFFFSNLTIKRSSAAERNILSKIEQTKASGVRDIPYKNLYPNIFRFVLNTYTMYPFCVLQKLFYNTNLGLILMGYGENS